MFDTELVLFSHCHFLLNLIFLTALIYIVFGGVL